MAVTPKLGLYLPEGTDTNHTETSINEQMKIIDNSFRVAVCKDASELPPTPYKGQLAYREDIHELHYWDDLSSSWVYILGRRNAWGRVAEAKNSTKGPDVGPNQEKGPYLSVTYNQIKGRIYSVNWNAETDSPNNGDFGTNQFRIRYRLGNSVSVSDSLLYWQWVDQANAETTASVSHAGGFSYTAETTGQITLGTFLWRGSSFPTIYFAPGHENNIIVEDVGWSNV